MPMAIVRRDDKFGAVLTGANYKLRYWSTEGFVSREELITALLSNGAHQTDIGDLLDELDRDPKKFCVLM